MSSPRVARISEVSAVATAEHGIGGARMIDLPAGAPGGAAAQEGGGAKP